MGLIPDASAAKLIDVTKAFRSRTRRHFRRLGAWRRLSNNDIWMRCVYQVAVVGNSACLARLHASRSAQVTLQFERLILLPPGKRATAVHSILRTHRVRYVSERPSECHKTRAVLRNLSFLVSVPGGPQGYLRQLATEKDENERARQLGKDLHYIKLKGSRDLMAELGLARNVVALDVRLLNLLRLAGVRVSSKAQNHEATYRRLQDALLEQVARPAGVNGVQLDRILFNNYEDILSEMSVSLARPVVPGSRSPSPQEPD